MQPAAILRFAASSAPSCACSPLRSRVFGSLLCSSSSSSSYPNRSPARPLATLSFLCSSRPFSSSSSSFASASPSSSGPSQSPAASASASAPGSRRKKTVPDAERAVSNLLYNIPASSETQNRHILSALVSNEPGVLSRISGVLAGRGFNIDSLVVSETETPGISRMTIVLRGGDSEIEQARRQIEDMVQIWAVVEYSMNVPVVERELLLVKVALTQSPNIVLGSKPQFTRGFSPAPASSASSTESPAVSSFSALHSSALVRTALIELARLFGGRVVDLTNEVMLIELTAKSSRLDAFISLVKPYGIIELARSGVLVLTRGPMREMEGAEDDPAVAKPAVDDTQLPPG